MLTGGAGRSPEGGRGYSNAFTIRSHDSPNSQASPLGPLGATSLSFASNSFCANATCLAASAEGLIS